jgi:hypothetical protein
MAQTVDSPRGKDTTRQLVDRIPCIGRRGANAAKKISYVSRQDSRHFSPVRWRPEPRTRRQSKHLHGLCSRKGVCQRGLILQGSRASLRLDLHAGDSQPGAGTGLAGDGPRCGSWMDCRSLHLECPPHLSLLRRGCQARLRTSLLLSNSCRKRSNWKRLRVGCDRLGL